MEIGPSFKVEDELRDGRSKGRRGCSVDVDSGSCFARDTKSPEDLSSTRLRPGGGHEWNDMESADDVLRFCGCELRGTLERDFVLDMLGESTGDDAANDCFDCDEACRSGHDISEDGICGSGSAGVELREELGRHKRAMK